MLRKTLTLSLLATVGLSSCFTEDSGTLTLKLTDAAVTDANNVVLSVAGVTIKGPDGQQKFEFLGENNEPEAKSIDLLSLTGAQSMELVSDWSLPAGEYQWLRLDVNTQEDGDSYVMIGDAQHEITIPSGELKLVSGFTVPANADANFTVDVDLYKGLVLSNGGYKLKPVMRLIDNAQVGHVSGIVDGNIFADNSCVSMAVYAFAGSDQTADDVFGDAGPDLVAWVDTTGVENQYELGFLTPGSYTLHLACDPADDPEVDDDVTFIADQAQNVEVQNNTTTTADFNL
ncbi:MAG: DUF4382 domain-containing protein [Reinekea sp.]|nr:DUF4382 domain-containing protein [Reinekea sp.]